MTDAVAKRDTNHIPVTLVVGDDADVTIYQLKVDSVTGRLLVDALIEEEGAATVGDGTKTVTTAGTRVQLDSQACKRVFIQSHESNVGTIVVGGSTVVAALVGRRGKALFATQGEWFKVSNTNLLYIDSTENSDKIIFYYEN